MHLMTPDDGATLRFRYRHDEAAAVQEIVGVFGTVDGDRVRLSLDQQATPELKASLDDVVARHARTMPHLHKLKQKIGRVPDSGWFLLMPHEPTSTEDRLRLERHLAALNSPDGAEAEDDSGDLFGPLLAVYDMQMPRTDRRTLVGARDRERRCRFCFRTKADGATFDKVAHVIPTALGNDHLKSLEECDECNGHFGDVTEPSLIALLDLQRVFLGTQGRGGRPQLPFGHGFAGHDGEKVVMKGRLVSQDEHGTFEVDLGKGAPMVPVDAYRALVKIALSVIDEGQLPHLRRTVEWVRNGLHADRPLPRVAMSTIDLPSGPSAQITLYVRRRPHPRLPHVVGEFRLGAYVFAFAVPLSDQDEWDLVGFFNDADFKDTFRHYMLAAKWVQQDLSGSERVSPAPRIRFVKR